MNAKLDYYRIFNEAASSLSFSQAAKNLYISQSAISQAIRQLELELQCKLFIRGAKGVSLSKEGKLLFSYIHNAMNLVDLAEKKLNDYKSLDAGTLIIGAGDTISSIYLLPFLEKFHTLYPKIKIQMINRTSIEMNALVHQEKVDIAFVNLPINDDTLLITPCLKVHDIFVCGDKYQDDQLHTLKDMSERPLILLENNSNSRRYVEEYFEASHIQLHPQIEIGAHELLLQLAHINLGVSCVIKEFSQTFLEEGYVFEMKLRKPIPPRYIGCVTLKKNPLSSAAQKFYALIQDSIDPMLNF